jgi:drug/metabolite transporter (DMT)-like permease
VLFIVALRHLRTARASAYYSIAPFAGATTAVTLDAPVTWQLGIAGVLMATGVWPHLTERHEHEHTYQSQDGPEGGNPLS